MGKNRKILVNFCFSFFFLKVVHPSFPELCHKLSPLFLWPIKVHDEYIFLLTILPTHLLLQLR